MKRIDLKVWLFGVMTGLLVMCSVVAKSDTKTTAKMLWKQLFPKRKMSAAPCIDVELQTAYVALYKTRPVSPNLPTLIALNVRTGNVKWQRDLGDIWRKPLVGAHHLVYVAAVDGTVYALSAKSGTQIWKTHLGISINSPMLLSEDKTHLYIFTTNGVCHAVNALDGTEVWQYRASGETLWMPVLTPNGILIFYTGDNRLYGLDTATRRILWRKTEVPILYFMSLYSKENLVFVTTKEFIFALDFNTGKTVYQYHKEGYKGSFHGAIMDSNKTLYVSDFSGIVALEKNAKITKWRLQHRVTTDISTGSSNLLFACTDTGWIAVNSQSGRIMYRYQVPRRVECVAPPVLLDTGLLLVPTAEEGVQAFQLSR